MYKRFTKATVEMDLNDYNDLMYRINLLENAISVAHPSWTKDFVEIRIDSEKLRGIIMQKINMLPYAMDYDFREEFFDATITIGKLKPEPTDEETSAGLMVGTLRIDDDPTPSDELLAAAAKDVSQMKKERGLK